MMLCSVASMTDGEKNLDLNVVEQILASYCFLLLLHWKVFRLGGDFVSHLAGLRLLRFPTSVFCILFRARI